jgi:hypothetical protein
MVGVAIHRPRRMGRVPLEEALMAAPDRMGVLVPPAARMQAQVLTEAIADLGLIWSQPNAALQSGRRFFMS